ncbi:hypothetical protein [Streptomyces sp. CRN 30]|uniref:hypothetical protein n=1 Tax=Streptomyces sp. CRN 30 TaxID=3075613 RepID=UPI002A80CEAE|nr:hypothetical protein [Streptomyces sp. CRN 30]
MSSSERLTAHSAVSTPLALCGGHGLARLLDSHRPVRARPGTWSCATHRSPR